MSPRYMSAKAPRQQTGMRFSENSLSFTESPSEIHSSGGSLCEVSRGSARPGNRR